MEVTPEIQIDESEIEERFVHASGPGGQNVNKVATGVELRFDVSRSTALPDEVKERLIQLAGSRMTASGILIIQARNHRTQKRNREEARERLANLIREAAQPVKSRKQTRTPASADARRLDEKRHTAEKKKSRRPDPYSDLD
jgi:ribosome-associated protein